jgi:hypothetical protein
VSNKQKHKYRELEEMGSEWSENCANNTTTLQPPSRPQPHFIWNVAKAWSGHPEGAMWLTDVVMPAYQLVVTDKRIPLCLMEMWERATPGCVVRVVGGMGCGNE